MLDCPLDGAVCDACWASLAVLPQLAGGPAHGLLASMAAVGAYEGRLRDIIHALKYDGRRSIAPRLGALMRHAGAVVLEGADAVVPVPLHRRRERHRGFNQADDLARALGLPVHRLLRRVAFTVPQVDLPAEERRRNVRHAFALRSRRRSRSGWLPPVVRGLLPAGGSPLPSPVGSTLVLVDDVSTTGATLEACARVLMEAGAREVRAVTAARVATARR